MDKQKNSEKICRGDFCGINDIKQIRGLYRIYLHFFPTQSTILSESDFDSFRKLRKLMKNRNNI